MATNEAPRPTRNADEPAEIYFTMKVYTKPVKGAPGNLKFSIDFNPPFSPDNKSIEPFFASPLKAENIAEFQKIFDQVMEVYKFIVNPTKYGSAPPSPPLRFAQQEVLAQVLRLNEGRINHITFEQNSPNLLGVGTTSLLGGNGDMRPPAY